MKYESNAFMSTTAPGVVHSSSSPGFVHPMHPELGFNRLCTRCTRQKLVVHPEDLLQNRHAFQTGPFIHKILEN